MFKGIRASASVIGWYIFLILRSPKLLYDLGITMFNISPILKGRNEITLRQSHIRIRLPLYYVSSYFAYIFANDITRVSRTRAYNAAHYEASHLTWCYFPSGAAQEGNHKSATIKLQDIHCETHDLPESVCPNPTPALWAILGYWLACRKTFRLFWTSQEPRLHPTWLVNQTTHVIIESTVFRSTVDPSWSQSYYPLPNDFISPDGAVVSWPI